jgi:hypothetical protein
LSQFNRAFSPGQTVTDFKKKILTFGGGLQQVSRYEVLLQGPGGLPAFVTYPENVALPPRSFISTPFSNWGPDFNIPVKREYGECAMSFIIYQDWYERKYIESWMDKVIPTGIKSVGGGGGGGGSAAPSAADFADYTNPYSVFSGNIQINCLSVTSNSSGSPGGKVDGKRVTAKITLNDVFPMSITPTTLSAEASGYGTFVAIFTFRDYLFECPTQL